MSHTEWLIAVIAKLLNQCILIILEPLYVHLRHFLAIAFSTTDVTILSLLIFHVFVLFTSAVALKLKPCICEYKPVVSKANRFDLSTFL